MRGCVLMQIKFCENLRLLRQSMNYTQAELADLLGISRSTYANYEVGKRSPDIDMLVKLSQALKVSMDELFGNGVLPTADRIRETKSSYHVENAPKERKKPLPIGVQEFRQLREKGCYYTDKTMMIAEFLESATSVTLITRPRRFGKTLNMSMLAEFLDCTKDSTDIFKGTAIMDTEFAQEINGHPVVFLSFLSVKGDSSNILLQHLFFTLSEEYRRHQRVWEDEKLEESLRCRMQEIYTSLNIKEVKNRDIYVLVIHAVKMLCLALAAYYDKPVYLLIDEYDVPFIEAHVNGYYPEGE